MSTRLPEPMVRQATRLEPLRIANGYDLFAVMTVSQAIRHGRCTGTFRTSHVWIWSCTRSATPVEAHCTG